MQTNRRASCFKRFKPDSEPFLTYATSQLNNHTGFSQSDPKTSPKNPFDNFGTFSSQRVHIYKDLFSQINTLKSTIAHLITHYPESSEPNTSPTSVILERELISGLIAELTGQSEVLRCHYYYQSLKKSCSLKRVLDEICPVEPTLVFGCKSDIPGESRRDEQPDSLGVYGTITNRLDNSPKDYQRDSLGMYVKSRQMKLADSPPNDEIEMAARDVSIVSDQIRSKSDVKRYLLIIKNLSQNMSISGNQKSMLKKAVLRNCRQIIAQLDVYQKDNNLGVLLDIIADSDKNNCPNQRTKKEHVG